MRINTMFSKILAVTMVGGLMIAPMTASAQSYRDRASTHRQQKKNEWRNLAYGSAAVGLLGLLNKNSTLTVAGAAGAAYSAWRYEQDRKSQSRIDRSRYSYNNYDNYNNYSRSSGRYASYDGRRDSESCRSGRGNKGEPKGWSQGKGHGYGRVHNPRFGH